MEKLPFTPAGGYLTAASTVPFVTASWLHTSEAKVVAAFPLASDILAIILALVGVGLCTTLLFQCFKYLQTPNVPKLGYLFGWIGILVIGGLIGFQISNMRLQSAIDTMDTKIENLEGQVVVEKQRSESYEQQSESFLAYIDRNLGAAKRSQAISEAPQQVLGPVGLLIVPQIAAEDYEAKLEQIRSDRELRPITEAETGLPIGELAFGTYFFALTGHVSSSKGPYSSHIDKTQNSSGRNRQFAFELQKLTDRSTHLVAYIDESTAAEIGTLDGTAQHTFNAYPTWSQSKVSLVSIPVERVISAKARRMDVDGRTMMALDMTIR